ncbi:unnamed protein product [Symbiodinium sp. CCMP2592]|nr:unnamed protein product [Symbiodinium sp. CCMP2592]
MDIVSTGCALNLLDSCSEALDGFKYRNDLLLPTHCACRTCLCMRRAVERRTYVSRPTYLLSRLADGTGTHWQLLASDVAAFNALGDRQWRAVPQQQACGND